MKSLSDTLTTLEKAFWTGDADFYRSNLTRDCRMVFPGMGILSREAAIQGVSSGQRWTSVELSDVQVAELTDEVAVLSYAATAWRGEQGDAYQARIGSVYLKEGGTWKLAFHQHTLAKATGEG